MANAALCPLRVTLRRAIPAQATAGAAQDTIVGTAPFDATVVAVRLLSEGAVTADNTNYRTLNLRNRGQNGAGATICAAATTKTAASGGTGNLAAYTAVSVPLAATAANRNVVAGDVLVFEELVAGTGVAHDGFTLEVELARR